MTATPRDSAGPDAYACLISVVIPTFNYAALLPRALESVIEQLASDIELIVIDDGSTDETADVLARFSQREPRVVVLHQANSGAAAARNMGIAEARGQFVLPLDADDQLLPDALQRLRGLITAQPQVEMVLAGRITRYTDGRSRLQLPLSLQVLSSRQLISLYLLRKRINIAHGSVLFRRSLLLVYPYPQGFAAGEDIPVFAGALARARVMTLPYPVVRINKHAGSLRRRIAPCEQASMRLVDEVFSRLPAECQPLSRRFRAQSYLSLFRSAWRVNQRSDARRYYMQAFKLSPMQAMRWSYLGKLLRMCMHIRSRNGF
ncbi:glycosyltransferase family 2 protein [Pseudomonas sp. TMP25]|uniref:glycosyltransferase family 2 protein n=1 Tax=Pseudomonas sp. TMP25 TaxID=3136561 RepID=UPI003101A245